MALSINVFSQNEMLYIYDLKMFYRINFICVDILLRRIYRLFLFLYFDENFILCEYNTWIY